MTALELLAPAKNKECALAAIDSGADAVYIGAPHFGARAAAGNSIDDIKSVVDYAHLFGAKVYVTVNTIVYDDELRQTEQLIRQLYDIHVDAILVQDMAILDMQLPPIAMHASTQTDNRSVEKVRWLANQGFRRVVLARELSLKEITAIHRAVPQVQLEVFVHGALCVSYSGQCYASQYCFHRSANRGECAQVCRLPFNLVDANGTLLVEHQHLLSLKDLCQIHNLERLALAGAVSFKIEGRLKDVDYVRNITAAYSQELDKVVGRHPSQFSRQAHGSCRYDFTPNVEKTFNRGYTTYFLDGRQRDIASLHTPKAIGEYVGRVKEIRGASFNVAGTSAFANGDGLCFFSDGQLYGFRVNRAEGNRLFPFKMPRQLRPGMRLYRNSDEAFTKILTNSETRRKISVDFAIAAPADALALTASSCGVSASVTVAMPHQEARSPQQENIIRILSKTGNTPFVFDRFDLPDDFSLFIPAATLTQLRRNVLEKLEGELREQNEEELREQNKEELREQNEEELREKNEVSSPPRYEYDYEYNSSNALSRSFYAQRGMTVGNAFEVEEPATKRVMQCRHCIRYTLGMCKKEDKSAARWKEPLYLVTDDANQTRFRLVFDCKNCKMDLYAE